MKRNDDFPLILFSSSFFQVSRSNTRKRTINLSVKSDENETRSVSVFLHSRPDKRQHELVSHIGSEIISLKLIGNLCCYLSYNDKELLATQQDT